MFSPATKEPTGVTFSPAQFASQRRRWGSLLLIASIFSLMLGIAAISLPRWYYFSVDIADPKKPGTGLSIELHMGMLANDYLTCTRTNTTRVCKTDSSKSPAANTTKSPISNNSTNSTNSTINVTATPTPSPTPTPTPTLKSTDIVCSDGSRITAEEITGRALAGRGLILLASMLAFKTTLISMCVVCRTSTGACLTITMIILKTITFCSMIIGLAIFASYFQWVICGSTYCSTVIKSLGKNAASLNVSCEEGLETSFILGVFVGGLELLCVIFTVILFVNHRRLRKQETTIIEIMGIPPAS